MKKLLLALAMLAGTATASALTVDSTVSDHCVLQQGMTSYVKGKGAANAEVTVTLGGTRIGSGKADSSGSFKVAVNPGSANATGRSLVVSDGSATRTISDVLVGEVWLIAGQSNAFNPMDPSKMSEYKDAYDDWKTYFDCPNVRAVVHSPDYTDSPDADLTWIVCKKANEEQMKTISPLGFFFARELYLAKNVPVGVTIVGRGANAIGRFMTPEAYAAARAARGGSEPPWGWGKESDKSNFHKWLTRFDTVTARGCVWSQGEAEAIVGGANGYRHSLKALIADWRSSSHRDNANFPVIISSTANYCGTYKSESDRWNGNYEGDGKSSTTRWEQEMVAQEDSHVVVVHAIDLAGNATKGYARAEHPTQKPELAARCCKAARSVAYGENVAYRCPYPTQAYFNSDKTKIYVTFPSSVSLTKKGEYTHIPFRVKNRGIQTNGTSVNPTSVKVGSDGHSLEIAFSGLTLNTAENGNSVAFCNVSGTADTTPLYEMIIYDQNGFPLPPFELTIANSSSGTDAHTHNWGNIKYTWSADNTTCSASATCTGDSSHTASQTVSAKLTVTKAATETTDGTGTRTAEFTSPFAAQTKTVTIPATGSGSGSGGADPEVPGDSSYTGVQLWANGPYWAEMNVGASSASDRGLFFSYGGTKGVAQGATAAFDGACPTWDKSVSQLQSANIVDSNGNLAKAYDAAYMTMGGTWRTPTKTELDGLRDSSKCTISAETVGGMKCLRISGVGDYAGRSIVLPCVGLYNSGNSYSGDQFCGYYMSATAYNDTGKIYGKQIQTGGLYDATMNRNNGYAIRAVSSTNPGGSTGGDETCDHSWGSASYSWSSDNETCTATRTCSKCSAKDVKSVGATYSVVTAATADADGKGRWTATFSSPYTTQTKDVTIARTGTSGGETGGQTGGDANGYEYVQLWANGPCFAKMNVGATSETGFGLMFSYGSTVGTTKGTTAAFDDGCPTSGKSVSLLQGSGILDSDNNLKAGYDAASVKMGGGWRMPTKAEIDALIANCDLEYVTVSGVKGTKVTGRGAFSSASIFIPCCGYYNAGGAWCNEQFYGMYLTATAESANMKVYTYALQQNVPLSAGTGNRANGFPIRAVITGVSGSGSGSGEEQGGEVNPGTGTHTHSWGAASYSWSSDNKSCTATRSCSGCSQKDTKTVSSTYEVVLSATDTADGKGRYTATFSAPFTTQTKDITIAKTGTGSGSGSGTGSAGGHEGVQLWKNGPYWATMNCGATSPTEAGYYYFGGADRVGLRVENGALKGKLVNNTGTTYWGDGWRQPTTAEAKLIKEYCTIDSTVGTDAKGQPYVVIRGKTAGYTDKSVIFPLAGYGNTGYVNESNRWGTYGKYWTSDTGVATRLCFGAGTSGAYIEYANGGYETSHPNRYTVRLVRDTMPEGGTTTTHTHSWGAPSYTWTQTASGWSCKASVTCTGDSSHVKEQTAAATYSVITEATTAAEGKGRYTATFSDSAFTTQTKDVSIAKKETTGGETGGQTPAVDPTPAFGAADYYVAPNGSDSNNGSASAPFATIQKAVSVASAGKKICVKKGVYNVQASGQLRQDVAAIVIDKAVTVFGETGDPEDVIVHNTKDWSDTDNYRMCYRVFKLNHAGAVISGLTVENGIARGTDGSDKFFGCNVKIDTNGGVVTNCIVRNGHIDAIFQKGADPTDQGGAAVACYSQNGLITHCVISNNVSSMGRTSPNQKNTRAATAVLLKAGTLRESLVAYNTVSECWQASAVHAEEDADATTLIENCTIAYNRYVDGGQYGNYSDSGEIYPIWVPLNTYDGSSRLPEIRNCLIYGNVTHKGGKTLIDWSKYADSQYSKAKAKAAAAFVNCATDMTVPSGMTATTVSASDMDGVKPKAGSALASKNIGGHWFDAGSGSGSGTGTNPGTDPGTNPGTDPGTETHTHAWGAATYTWSADGKSCTAKRACSGCTVTETETVTAAFVTVRAATTEATGLGHYEASFKNSAFAKQTGADVVIPMKKDEPAPTGDYYVSASGSDSNAGTSSSSAFATIGKAVSTAAAGSRICILEGTYTLSEEVSVDKAVTIVGAGYERTIVKAASGKSIRLFTLDGGARLEGVTLTGGKVYANSGAGAWVKNGTISWCCISNNVGGAHNELGGGVSFSAGQGAIDHSIVTDNRNSGQGAYGAGIGGSSTKGAVTIDSCLVYGNSITGGGAGGGIGFKDANYDLVIRNCTIIGNKGTLYAGGIDKEGGSGKVVMINDIVCGNLIGTAAGNLKIANLDTTNSKNCFFGSASEVTTYPVPGSLSGDPALDGGYRPSASSPVYAAGVSYTGIGDDLDGNPFASTPSIGCYEFGTVAAPDDESADWEKPAVTIGTKTSASEAWPTLAKTPLAKANALKLKSWASARSVSLGSLAGLGEAEAEAVVNSFLLNCANTPEAIAAAKAGFKFTAFDPLNPPTAEEFAAMGYNGVVRIEGLADLTSDEWGPAADGDKYYRAVLTVE